MNNLHFELFLEKISNKLIDFDMKKKILLKFYFARC